MWLAAPVKVGYGDATPVPEGLTVDGTGDLVETATGLVVVGATVTVL